MTLYEGLKRSRKKDREIMMRALERLCKRFNIAYNIHSKWLGQPRVCAIELEGPTGLTTVVDFDGEDGLQEYFLVSWHMAVGTPKEIIIKGDFAGDINAYHRRKATDVFRGFEVLLRHMSVRLQRIAEGSATEIGQPKQAVSTRILPSTEQ